MAFGAQGVFNAALGLVLAVYMGKFYVDVVLLPAGLYAVAIAAGRALDAITDPLMGYVSDHTRSRFGRRKPWVLIGSLGAAVLVYLMLTPDPALSTAGVMTWFVSTYIITYLFLTVVNVPRAALAAELTFEPKERMSLYGTTAVFVAVGLLISAVMPTVLSGLDIKEPRLQMQVQAGAYVVGYALLHLALLAFVRERAEFQGRGETPFVPGVRRALRNRPFRVTFVSHVVTSIPVAIPATVMPFYVQYVLGAEAKWTGILILTYLFSGFLALPFWIYLARRIGKLPVWFINGFIGVSGGTLMFFAGPGDTGYAFCVEAYVGMQSQVWIFLAGAMHADVIDYDELHTGRRREAQFTALWTIIPKLATIPGAAIPFAVLGGLGYMPNLAEQSPQVVEALRWLISLVPAVFNAIGISLMRWYPLNERVHQEVRAAIAQHERGESAVDPVTAELLPPPHRRDVDEQTAWFLDHFSARELRSYAERAREPLASVWLQMLLCAAVAVGSLLLSAASIPRWDADPGPKPTLLILLSGLSLAMTLFNGLRLRPAMRLRQQGVPRDVVERHLASVCRPGSTA